MDKNNLPQRRDKMEMTRVKAFVLDQIVKGSSTQNIIASLKAQFAFKTDVNCRKVIHQVTKELQTNNEKDVEQARAIYLQRYEDLYHKCLREERMNDARMVLDSMSKISGVIVHKVEQKAVQLYQIEFT